MFYCQKIYSDFNPMHAFFFISFIPTYIFLELRVDTSVLVLRWRGGFCQVNNN